jgi:hypothetical protein
MKMSETKHTPGPWHTAGDQGVQIRSQRDQIAKVWTMRGNEWKANARLIAAAPELLEALKDMIVLQAGTSSDPVETLRKARAAIAKATTGA